MVVVFTTILDSQGWLHAERHARVMAATVDVFGLSRVSAPHLLPGDHRMPVLAMLSVMSDLITAFAVGLAIYQGLNMQFPFPVYEAQTCHCETMAAGRELSKATLSERADYRGLRCGPDST